MKTSDFNPLDRNLPNDSSSSLIRAPVRSNRCKPFGPACLHHPDCLSRSGVSAVQLLHLELVPYIRHEIADMLFCRNAHDIRGDPGTPAVGKDGNVGCGETIVEQSDDAITDIVLVLESCQSVILSVLAPGISYWS
ncbi:hypothetical protein CY34DRAFT_426212 [Suillus luteus UH-Slu-Lm8-n1]|uniref:Unplaced genomic scaffold CY34scaffold_295, whole genome shotgun sequence n=1 Tax=Suillus luteus UH-Slu-Lm8-n1 TaxID=930992 RepID=A0A0C9ZK36_9AGAM|nr:hypothetical protein CY34DRAFT_426212 [Suillus luteus UH-Slu-Lm8-n1]